jgi:hypothetical protein
LTRDTQNLDEAVEDAFEGTLGEQLVSVVRSEDPDESGLIRPFVVLDLRSALRSVRRSDAPVPGIDQAAAAASELTSEGDLGTDSGSQSGDADSGRGLLTRLFLAGLVAGAVYGIRNRRQSGTPSVDEAAEEAADETQTLAERAASTIQQRGEVAASRIEEGTDALAERIEDTGTETARQIQETGEQIDEVESQAEETVEEATGSETGGSSDDGEE